LYNLGVRQVKKSTVGLGTVLQAGRSSVQFPMGLSVFIDLMREAGMEINVCRQPGQRIEEVSSGHTRNQSGRAGKADRIRLVGRLGMACKETNRAWK
jgi:hypothetical protein